MILVHRSGGVSSSFWGLVALKDENSQYSKIPTQPRYLWKIPFPATFLLCYKYSSGLGTSFSGWRNHREGGTEMRLITCDSMRSFIQPEFPSKFISWGVEIIIYGTVVTSATFSGFVWWATNTSGLLLTLLSPWHHVGLCQWAAAALCSVWNGFLLPAFHSCPFHLRLSIFKEV